MPFPSEHAARQKDPGQYKNFRRFHPRRFPEGIDVVLGINGDASEIQSFRFDKDKWTVEAAREWLKVRGFKTNIEEATDPAKVNKSFWTGAL